MYLAEKTFVSPGELPESKPNLTFVVLWARRIEGAGVLESPSGRSVRA